MKSKISAYQFFLMAALAAVPAALEFVPSITAEGAKTAGWVVPLVSCVYFVPSMLCVLLLGKMCGGMGCSDALGKYGGAAAGAVLSLWCAFSAAFYLGSFSLRVVTYFLSDASRVFVVLSMLAVVAVVLFKGFLPYARLMEIVFYVFAVLFLLLTVFALIANARAENLLPVGVLDAPNAAVTAFMPLSVFSVFVPVLLLSSRIDKRGATRAAVVGIVAVAVVMTLGAAVTIGALGHAAVSTIETPFFPVVKTIEFLRPFEKTAAAVLCLWVITDFAAISFFCRASAAAITDSLGVKSQKTTLAIVLVAVLAVCLLFFQSSQTIELIYNRFLVYLNGAIAVVVPSLILFFAWLKHRKQKP